MIFPDVCTTATEGVTKVFGSDCALEKVGKIAIAENPTTNEISKT